MYTHRIWCFHIHKSSRLIYYIPLGTKKFTCLKRKGISVDAMLGGRLASLLNTRCKCGFFPQRSSSFHAHIHSMPQRFLRGESKSYSGKRANSKLLCRGLLVFPLHVHYNFQVNFLFSYLLGKKRDIRKTDIVKYSNCTGWHFFQCSRENFLRLTMI